MLVPLLLIQILTTSFYLSPLLPLFAALNLVSLLVTFERCLIGVFQWDSRQLIANHLHQGGLRGIPSLMGFPPAIKGRQNSIGD